VNRRRLAVALGLVVSLTGCGISSDDAPRNVPAAEQQQLGISDDRTAGDATGTARVYLLSPEAPGQALALQAVARDVDETSDAVLQALFAGPNAAEVDSQLRTALPTGMELLSARIQGGTLRLDVSEGMLQLSGQVLVAAVAQIVFTAAEIDGVSSVTISVDGSPQRWPVGNGELQSAPLTVYDYPGLVPSAQPAYPAIPTPAQPTS
jgi:spore germination protein GerM